MSADVGLGLNNVATLLSDCCASRTRLYREYKFCRLLLRPAVNDQRAVTGRSASLRQTAMSGMCWYSGSSLADHDDDDDDDGDDGGRSRDDVAVTCVVFADDATNDAQTNERVTSLESKHQMSLQSMKELLLNSVNAVISIMRAIVFAYFCPLA